MCAAHDSLPLDTPWAVREEVAGLRPYVPGLSIDEIREQYGLSQVVKMASNENPLGISPLVAERIRIHATGAFRYPQGGNPRLVRALAARHKVAPERIVAGNGSDELIDLLIRTRAVPGVHNIVCFDPCFSIYPLQARICGVDVRQTPLAADFSFPFDELRALVDAQTALVFVTTPDNPSGYCPPPEKVCTFARSLPPGCLLVVDEAYMDFADEEAASSLLAQGAELPNVAFLRTFSKSFGLAGLRLGYAVLPAPLADCLWRARLPFSVDVLAEEAGLAALEDDVFYSATLAAVREGRAALTAGMTESAATFIRAEANFLLFAPPVGVAAADLFEQLLRRGDTIRPLKSYNLPHMLRVSVGSREENAGFLAACRDLLG